jgi:hypothetical protein
MLTKQQAALDGLLLLPVQLLLLLLEQVRQALQAAAAAVVPQLGSAAIGWTCSKQSCSASSSSSKLQRLP